MTYGWSLLIIAIVTGVLFEMGVFNLGAILPNACLASSGYMCKNPTLVTSGLMSFSFGQNTGSPLYNFQLACAATSASTGEPNPLTAFNSISSSGFSLPASNTGNTLANGQVMTITSLSCYNSVGQALSNMNMGAGFSGYIWVNYTMNSGTANAVTNPWHTAKVISVSARVV